MFVLKSYFMKMLWSCLLIVGLIQPGWSVSACCVLSAWGLLCHLQGRTSPPISSGLGSWHIPSCNSCLLVLFWNSNKCLILLETFYLWNQGKCNGVQSPAPQGETILGSAAGKCSSSFLQTSLSYFHQFLQIYLPLYLPSLLPYTNKDSTAFNAIKRCKKIMNNAR